MTLQDLAIIDAHHHLWDLDNNSYPWLQKPAPKPEDIFVGDIRPLQKSYLLPDLKADFGDLNVVKSVHLQADYNDADPLGETRWLQDVADAEGSGGFPQAIVPYANLADPDVDALLAAHAGFANVRGIRQILNTHEQGKYAHVPIHLMNDPQWERGYARLAAHGLSFDLQLYPFQMDQAAAIVARHQDIQVIINHTGMPIERDEAGQAYWRTELAKLAAIPHVSIKISGLGMLDHHWSEDSIRPFVLETIDLFGVERCLFASNFPVDKLFSSYRAIWEAFFAITSGCSDTERRALFHDNAARLYRI